LTVPRSDQLSHACTWGLHTALTLRCLVHLLFIIMKYLPRQECIGPTLVMSCSCLAYTYSTRLITILRPHTQPVTLSARTLKVPSLAAFAVCASCLDCLSVHSSVKSLSSLWLVHILLSGCLKTYVSKDTFLWSKPFSDQKSNRKAISWWALLASSGYLSHKRGVGLCGMVQRSFLFHEC